MGDYLSVAFPHRDWGLPTLHFRDDVRPSSRDGYVWDLEVRTHTEDPVELTFDIVGTIPGSFEVWLVDETAGVHKDLRHNPAYAVAGPGEGHVRSLKLVVGDDRYVGQQLGGVPEMPRTLGLSQPFPNPFSGSTTFRVSLPHSAPITIDVLDLLGRRVRTITARNDAGAGHHAFIWDGRTDSGAKAASGLYVVRLQTRDHLVVRKTTLIR